MANTEVRGVELLVWKDSPAPWRQQFARNWQCLPGAVAAAAPVWFTIDKPLKGSLAADQHLDVSGWLLSPRSPVKHIDLTTPERILHRFYPQARPDVDTVLAPQCPPCGWSGQVLLLGLAPESSLDLEAVLASDARVPLARIHLQCGSFPSGFQPRLQPILLNSLGRTGTTLLMRALGAHPAIVVPDVFPYEVRVCQHWMQALVLLQQSMPAMPLQPASWEGVGQALLCDHFSLRPELGQRSLSVGASYCQEAVEGFYQEVARRQQVPQAAAYFAEKFLPEEKAWMVRHLYPCARDVFLVRDFRDMLCSIRAVNRKWGKAAFGRNRFSSDLDHVRRLGEEAGRLLRDWRNRREQGLLLRYEDLVLRPEDSLRALFDFLEVDCCTAILEQVKNRMAQDTPETRDHRTIANPTDTIGRWRHELDDESVALCNVAFAEPLQAFGYDAPA